MYLYQTNYDRVKENAVQVATWSWNCESDNKRIGQFERKKNQKRNYEAYVTNSLN